MDLWTLLADKITHHRQVRKTITELEALDDRTLDDLGIVRCDIRAIAHQTETPATLGGHVARKDADFLGSAGYQAS